MDSLTSKTQCLRHKPHVSYLSAQRICALTYEKGKTGYIMAHIHDGEGHVIVLADTDAFSWFYDMTSTRNDPVYRQFEAQLNQRQLVASIKHNDYSFRSIRPQGKMNVLSDEETTLMDKALDALIFALSQEEDVLTPLRFEGAVTGVDVTGDEPQLFTMTLPELYDEIPEPLAADEELLNRVRKKHIIKKHWGLDVYLDKTSHALMYALADTRKGRVLMGESLNHPEGLMRFMAKKGRPQLLIFASLRAADLFTDMCQNAGVKTGIQINHKETMRAVTRVFGKGNE